MRIKSKKQMYDLLLQNRLGNTLRTWRTPEEISGPYGCRSVVPSCQLNLFGPLTTPIPELRRLIKSHGLDPDKQVLYCEVPPDSKRTIQGEVTRTSNGLYFFYTYKHDILRYALRDDSNHCYGLEALERLRYHLHPESFDEIFQLLDRYDDPVIEFTAYSIPVGVNNKHHVIWEVRNDY